MATKYWLGTADAVAKVMTATPANPNTGDIYYLKVGGVTIASFTVAGTETVAAVTAGLTSAWDASTHIYATQITASDQTTHVELTSAVAGLDFVVTSDVYDGGGGTAPTLTMATTTANAGPNDWGTAANWSTGAVPVDDDDVIIDDSDVNICWGLDQSAVTLDSLRITQRYTGRIGLDYTALATTADGETTNSSKAEYRDCYLQIGVDGSDGNVDIGEHAGPGDPTGSGRILIDLGSTAAQVVVHNTAATSADTGRPAVRLKANSSTTDLHVRYAPGGVGVATELPGETSTIGDVNVSEDGAVSQVFTGAGVTLTNWYQTGGTNVMQAAATVTLVKCHGGSMRIEGKYQITTLEAANGGIVYDHHHNSTSAVATMNIKNGGTVDGSGASYSRTWGSVNLERGATLIGNEDTLSIANLYEPDGKYTITAA